MKHLSQPEHVTALFVIAMYHWYMGDVINAKAVIAVATMAATMPPMCA